MAWQPISVMQEPARWLSGRSASSHGRTGAALPGAFRDADSLSSSTALAAEPQTQSRVEPRRQPPTSSAGTPQPIHTVGIIYLARQTHRARAFIAFEFRLRATAILTAFRQAEAAWSATSQARWKSSRDSCLPQSRVCTESVPPGLTVRSGMPRRRPAGGSHYRCEQSLRQDTVRGLGPPLVARQRI